MYLRIEKDDEKRKAFTPARSMPVSTFIQAYCVQKGKRMGKNSYTLVVTEKPSVAESIASAIAGSIQKKNGYLEGSGYLVSWCVGHLAEPAQPEEYKEAWKRWSLDSLPVLPEKWKYVIKKETEGQYETLRRLLHREDVEGLKI